MTKRDELRSATDVGVLDELARGSVDAELWLLEAGRRRLRQAIPSIVEHLTAREPAIRSAAVEALGWIGDRSAAPAILAMLEDDQPAEVLDTAAYVLGGLAYSPARSALQRMLLNVDPSVRKNAAGALASIPGPGAYAFMRLAMEREKDLGVLDEMRSAARSLLERDQQSGKPFRPLIEAVLAAQRVHGANPNLHPTGAGRSYEVPEFLEAS